MPALTDKAERNPPRHVPYDAWRNRIDEIQVDDAWHELVRIGQEAGLVACHTRRILVVTPARCRLGWLTCSTPRARSRVAPW